MTREDAIDVLKHNYPSACFTELYDAVEIAIQALSASTIDAVPVVRCKDCRWHEEEQSGMVYCPATVGGWVEDNWFCKGGERKDDG